MVRRNFKEAMKYTTYNDRGVYVHVAVKFPLGSPDACSSSSNCLRKNSSIFFKYIFGEKMKEEEEYLMYSLHT